MNFYKLIKSVPFKCKWLFCKLGYGTEPDFLILGAQKAGTTSLFDYISKYSENFVPPQSKELQFFTERYAKGLPWYRARFPLVKKKGHITGEATPDYLFFGECAARVYRHYPQMKFIVLLRNPVERAFSQYNFQNNSDKVKDSDQRSFINAVKDEINILNNESNIEKCVIFSNEKKYFSYVERGLYFKQLKKWFYYFPKSSFMIIDSESFYSDPQSYLVNLSKFLGLKLKNLDEVVFKAQNKTSYANEMDSEARRLLENYYRAANNDLYEILQQKFDW